MAAVAIINKYEIYKSIFVIYLYKYINYPYVLLILVKISNDYYFIDFKIDIHYYFL